MARTKRIPYPDVEVGQIWISIAASGPRPQRRVRQIREGQALLDGFAHSWVRVDRLRSGAAGYRLARQADGTVYEHPKR